jgi:hypothetical protein
MMPADALEKMKTDSAKSSTAPSPAPSTSKDADDVKKEVTDVKDVIVKDGINGIVKDEKEEKKVITGSTYKARFICCMYIFRCSV